MTQQRPPITISIGAYRDTVTVGDTVFDRSKMARDDKRKLSRMLVQALEQETEQRAAA